LCAPLAFLRDAIRLDGGSAGTDDAGSTDGAEPVGACALLVPPAAWRADLSGLPGHDPATGGLRATADPVLLRDAQGREIACPGWAHPLVRRAAERMRMETQDGPDPRIAVARGKDGPAVLLTYALDLRDGTGSALREVIAVHLNRTGDARVVADPVAWLALGGKDATPGPEETWSRLFAPWVAEWRDTAQAAAAEAARVIVERFRASHDAMLARENRTLATWLDRRTTEIAGPWTPPSPDLFGFIAAAPDWQTLPAAPDRLTAFAADATTPAEPRRDAAAALARFRDRSEALAARVIQGAPSITPIGMLMLVPDAP
jgi:hypothetical protein